MRLVRRHGLGLMFTCTASITGLVGCQTMKVDELPSNADPTAEINKTQDRINDDAMRQLDVVAPDSFSKARDALASAKKDRDEGKDNVKSLHEVAVARAYLNTAENSAKISQASLTDVLKAREAAVAAGAPTVEESDFKSADSKLKDIGAQAENGDLKKAESEHEKLANTYAKLEVGAIKINRLGGAKGDLTQAIKEGAKDDAPQTLDKARGAIITAEQFIDSNPHDTAGIDQRVQDANAQAAHVLDVTRKVKTATKSRPEDVVLSEEAAQNQLTDQQKQLAAQQAALAAEQGKVNSLNQTNSQLQQQQMAEQTFQEKFTAAKAMFEPSEADVLRDGDRLVIRLKALTFPKGANTIPSSDYAVLTKAQQVIKSFTPSAIDVQGHTDSTGGKKLNQKLSTQRAEAVQQYLVANGVQQGQVTAEGFGDSRPIASNKDADGRAQNRRIDLVLTPSTTAH